MSGTYIWQYKYGEKKASINASQKGIKDYTLTLEVNLERQRRDWITSIYHEKYTYDRMVNNGEFIPYLIWKKSVSFLC